MKVQFLDCMFKALHWSTFQNFIIIFCLVLIQKCTLNCVCCVLFFLLDPCLCLTLVDRLSFNLTAYFPICMYIERKYFKAVFRNVLTKIQKHCWGVLKTKIKNVYITFGKFYSFYIVITSFRSSLLADWAKLTSTNTRCKYPKPQED